DSTDRIAGTTLPGAATGHELFKAVDIVGDRLFVAYNAGLQSWAIEGVFSERPRLLSFRDGWRGHFLAFPSPPLENPSLVEDVDALASGGATLLGLSGKVEVGTTLWTWTGSQFVLHYQDVGTPSRQVRLVEADGRVYAVVASDDINVGLAVYDVTAASSLVTPCLDERGTSACGSDIFLGRIPTSTFRRYLDVFSFAGKIYVAASANELLPMEIWELGDPARPETAVLRFVGPPTAAGVEMFTRGGTPYLAAVAATSPTQGGDEIHIYAVDHCLDGDGCTTLGTPRVRREARFWPNTSEQFVTYSESSGRPFLYYGAAIEGADGGAVEQLLDLSRLGQTDRVTEITEGGGTYLDPCNGKTVDYWGDYYETNAHGLRNFYPRSGKFAGPYFYRAGNTVLDVHVYSAPPSLIFADGFESGGLSAWGGSVGGIIRGDFEPQEGQNP
ncbi:MAG: hypothetical protein AAGD06_26510, partial [Acidobacteriota bacterium]